MLEEGKRHLILIKDFNTFMYDHTLHHGRKHFCCYCLQAFNREEILKCHFKIVLKLMVNKGLKCLKKMNTLNSKYLKEK